MKSTCMFRSEPVTLLTKVVLGKVSSCLASAFPFTDKHPGDLGRILLIPSVAKQHLVYSCFEKGCRKKCTCQSRKVLWVVLSSLFFKEI